MLSDVWVSIQAVTYIQKASCTQPPLNFRESQNGCIPLQLLLPKHSTFHAREQFGQISPFTGASLKGVVLLAGVDGVAGTPWVLRVFSGVGGWGLMKAVGRLIRTSSSVLWKASASPKCAQRKACRACLTLSLMHMPGRGGCDTSATAFLGFKRRDTLETRFDMCFKLAWVFR